MDSTVILITLGIITMPLISGWCIHKAFHYCADAAITIPAPRWWINEMDKATMRRMEQQQRRADRNRA